MIIKLKNVRLSFPELFVPSNFQGQGELKYKATFLVPKKHPQVAEFTATLLKVAEEKWGVKAKAAVASIIADNPKCYCLKDGDKKSHDGYADNFYINASNKKRPTVVDADTTPLTEKDGRPYAGCYVMAHLDIWAQENKYGKGLNATLCGVQFMRDGDPFTGGNPSSEDAFEDLSVSQDEGALC